MILKSISKVDQLSGQAGWTKPCNSLTLDTQIDCKNVSNEPITKPNPVLYTPVNTIGFNRSGIMVHFDCPPSVLEYIQYRIEYTIPVMNWIFPEDPCWKHLGKSGDGYAKHNPRRFKNLPEKAQNCSTQLSRFIYIWLNHPIEGLPLKYNVDHMCGRGTNKCINPRHLQPLTPEINKSLGNRDFLKP